MKIDFKNLNEKCGIYKIINKKNGKFYIGSSKNIYDRLHQHFHKLKNNKHSNKHLQSSYNLYGEKSFKYTVITLCDLKEQFVLEQYYLDLLKPEYNKTNNVIANYGVSPTKEHREKISKTLKSKYKLGEIDCYRQEHLWKTRYIYNIYTFERIKICKNLKESLNFLNVTNIKNNKVVTINNNFVIIDNYYDDIIDLKNYIYKNCYKTKKGKYIILKENNTYKYFRKVKDLCNYLNFNIKTFYKYCSDTFVYNGNMIYYTENFIKVPF